MSFIIDGLNELTFKLANLAVEIKNQKFLAEAAAYVKAQILKRTATGVDADKKKFHPYSRSWKKARQKVGLPTRKVDLFFYGEMLSSIVSTIAPDRATLFFAPSADRRGVFIPEKAYYNQEGRVKRKFFAMADSDIDYLTKKYTALIEKALNK